MTSSVNLTAHNYKIRAQATKVLVKTDQYQIIFQMRCIPALFVDIDFWQYVKNRAHRVQPNPL